MLVSVVWIAPAVLATINQVAQRRLHGEPPASARELLWAGGDWLVYAFLTPAVFWVSGRWPIVRPRVAERLARHLVVALLFCAAWATGGKLLELLLVAVLDPERLRAGVAEAGDAFWRKAAVDWLSWIFTTLPFGVVVYLCLAGVAHAIRYFTEASERQVQLARLSEQLTSERLAALQARLNPHFLFNTLNTIAVRARDGDGAGTARLVEQLGDVLRSTLRRQKANEVTLAEELELVRQYLAIEQARFSDRLRPSYEIDEALLAAAVPSFALQHLVENAVRHGIAKRIDAGVVLVRARRVGDVVELSVTDDGAAIDPRAAFPGGHGLESTRERLRALYGERASLEVVPGAARGTLATLRVPYRELEEETDVAER